MKADRTIAAEAAAEQPKVPYVVFEGVRCNTDPLSIDVYLDEDHDDRSVKSTLIGQSTRLGMGVDDVQNGESKNQSRCEKAGITRAIEVGEFSQQLRANDGKV